MASDLRAIVQLDCHCGERFHISFDSIQAPITCPLCEHEATLGGSDLEAIEAALGRALVDAHRRTQGRPASDRRLH
ncbi:hypothetical protein WG901_21590 [Novosphingobium sp. PS1R-30]|uniref:Uncharacterized protein n=1 Tax=Novosphingobium anseongense TaxID=3133436 RepID=A0ABU8S1M8_9SPHN